MNRKKVSRASVFLMLAVLFLGMTVIAAKAFIEPDGWSDPAIFVQDIHDTPGQRGPEGGDPYDPWYDDAKGATGNPENELLYVYIDWNNDYLYVRWDAEESASKYGAPNPPKVAPIYYLLSIDTLMRTPAIATRLLQFEVNQAGAISVTIRDATSPAGPLWTGTVADYSITSIPYSSPLTERTALEGRYPWPFITGGGPADILVMRAESHSGPAQQGLCSEVMDYICITDNPVPWFSSLTLTMVVAVALVAFLVKKKGTLPATRI